MDHSSIRARLDGFLGMTVPVTVMPPFELGGMGIHIPAPSVL